MELCTNPLTRGRSRTLGRIFASGMAETSILGTPMSVNVMLRTKGGSGTIWILSKGKRQVSGVVSLSRLEVSKNETGPHLSRTVPTIVSTAIQMGTGI